MVVCSSSSSSTNVTRTRRFTAVLECTQCRRKFLNEADRELHVREAHQIVKENFECPQCGKQFGNRHILQLHTRLHASQSSSTFLAESSSSDAIATLTSATQSNGNLNINFNVSLNINLNDGIDPSDLDSKLNDLLANAAKVSFQEALKREKTLAIQQKADPEKEKSAESSPVKSPAGSEAGTSSPCSKTSPETSTINIEDNINSVISIENESKPEAPAKPKLPSIRINPHNRPKKTVGLTKIRMEDCQRCDACSCIYLDEKDYIKHMKNFHKQDVVKKEPIKPTHKGKPKQQSTPIERRRRHPPQQQSQSQQYSEQGRKGSCRSCCKQCKCRGDHTTLEPMLPIVRPVLGRSGRRGSSSSSNQDSWNQFANQLKGAEGFIIEPDLNTVAALAQIKPDPDVGVDFSDLLSQVEVKIKTEPVDQEESAVKIKSEPIDEMDTDCSVIY